MSSDAPTRPSGRLTLESTVLGAPDRPALVSPADGRTLSYAELRSAVDRLACQLVAAGTRPGDVVALSGPNGIELVAAFLGIVASGATAAPLNPAYTVEELRAYLEDLRAVRIVLVGDPIPAAETAAAALGCDRLRLPVPAAGELGLEDARGTGERPDDDPDAVALLLHTSGTTSRPKGVPLRQRNLAVSANVIAAHYGLGPGDVSHCVMPLFHVHGLIASTLATFASGGTVVVPRRFSARAFWRDTARHGATWYSAVPTIHRTLLDRAGEDPAERRAALRFARSCSSALPPSLMAAFEARFGVPMVEAYGMTEAAHQMASNPVPPGERRPGSVGVPTGVEAAILDDDWRPLAPGQVGEVAVRGPSVVDGYRDNPEANAASFRDGWFRTGDRGRQDPDGRLWLEGRIKEIINRGGEKISPHEVENALLSHPAVVEAVAYAVPDDRYGEQVGAAVVTRGRVEADALRRHCCEQLVSFKVPHRLAVVDAIPKGPTGKMQRRLLAELLGP